MVRRALAGSRTEAQEAIRAGLVTIDGAPALKSSTQVTAGQAIVVAGPPRAYVSRGGEKLAHGLDVLGVDPRGRRCLDAGVSTGGFTDCLLQRGASHVFAFDVGYGQVHESIRTHPRVTVHERTNVRDLDADMLPPPAPELLVADLSFISLTMVLPTLLPLLAAGGEAVVLVKPQFEATRDEVGRGGVVRDPAVWRRGLDRVAASVPPLGWRIAGATSSSLLGPAGNVEFLVSLVDHRQASRPPTDPPVDPGPMFDLAVAQGVARRAGGSTVSRS